MKINDKTFFTTFGAIVLLTSLLLFYIHQFPLFIRYAMLSIVGVTVFSLMTLWVYFMAKYYAAQCLDTKYANLIYLNTSIKFLVTIALPVAYYFIFNKPTGTFVLPFLLIYIVFTIYSTWLLNKMATMRKLQ